MLGLEWNIFYLGFREIGLAISRSQVVELELAMAWIRYEELSVLKRGYLRYDFSFLRYQHRILSWSSKTLRQWRWKLQEKLLYSARRPRAWG